MTLGGGDYGDGMVFSLTAGGGTPTTLLSFNGANGASPFGDLILSGSTLYGVTASGGAYGDGTVFSLPVGGGTPTTLLSFNGTNGASPCGNLILSGSTLYGTTVSGGDYNDGTIFALALPEPSTFVLLILGSSALFACACRRRLRAA
jgi:uncharacterized repeat protein (TIGR03803 family)